jgi:hypothetical protein
MMTGAVFQPELIKLMQSVLDDATATLACAAKGERDPIVLRSAALSAVKDRTRYSHDISEHRRAV